jgi:hypothetical protein
MRNPEQRCGSAFEFTLRLARAENLRDDEAVDAIYEQIRRVELMDYFPAYFQRIDPDNFFPETKLLEPHEKRRLSEAVARYGLRKKA